MVCKVSYSPLSIMTFELASQFQVYLLQGPSKGLFCDCKTLRNLLVDFFYRDCKTLHNLREGSFKALMPNPPGSEPTFQLCECVDLDVALLLGLPEPQPEPPRHHQRRALRPPLPPQLRCSVTRDT